MEPYAVRPAGAPRRDPGIDALRAAVTCLVVFHHAALTYGGSGSWYYREVPASIHGSGLVLTLFCAVNQAWFMGLFFLLAGYYTPPAHRRRGTAGFVRERLLRLGLPLLAYALLLHPLTAAMTRAASGRPFGPAVLALWRRGALEPGPLWFAEALLLFGAVWLAWRAIGGDGSGGRAFPSDRALLAAAVATGTTAFALRLVWPVGTVVGFLQLGYFVSYVVLFAAGCAAATPGWLERIPPVQARRWLVVSLVALPALPLAVWLGARLRPLSGSIAGGWSLPALVYAFWEPFVAWGVILGLFRVFQRRLPWPGPVWPRLSRRAFLIFIVHPPILVAVALCWRSIAWPALAKFIVTGSIACVCCYIVAGLLLRVPAMAKVV